MTLLLLGVYFGGLVTAWVNVWLRNDEPSIVLIIGPIAWPLSLLSIAIAGKYAVREQLDILTNEEIDDLREDVEIYRERAAALERAMRQETGRMADS